MNGVGVRFSCGVPGQFLQQFIGVNGVLETRNSKACPETCFGGFGLDAHQLEACAAACVNPCGEQFGLCFGEGRCWGKDREMQQFRRKRLPAAEVRVAAQAEPFPPGFHKRLGAGKAQLGGVVNAVAVGLEPGLPWSVLPWVPRAEMFSIHAQETQ